MRKAAYLDLTLRDPAGAPAADLQRMMETHLSGTHDGLTIQVQHTNTDPADPLARHVVLYVEGDQPAPDDFQRFATGVVERLWQNAASQGPQGAALTTGAPAAPRPTLTRVTQWEDYDSMEGQTPAARSSLGLASLAALSSSCLAPVTGGSPVAGNPLPSKSAAPASRRRHLRPVPGRWRRQRHHPEYAQEPHR